MVVDVGEPGNLSGYMNSLHWLISLNGEAYTLIEHACMQYICGLFTGGLWRPRLQNCFVLSIREAGFIATNETYKEMLYKVFERTWL